MEKKSKAKNFFRDHIRPILSKLTGTQEIHWCCVVMDEATRKMVLKLDPQQLDVLEISGCDGEYMNFKSYEIAHYPDFDICTTVLEKKYDLIIADQVFEHVLKPYRAATNVYSMLRKGGHFLIAVPFLIKYHGCPEVWALAQKK